MIKIMTIMLMMIVLLNKNPAQAVRQDRRADRGGEKQDQPTDELCEDRARGKLQSSR